MDRPVSFKKIFSAGLIIMAAADFFTRRHHEYFPWDSIPGFSAIFALSSAVLIIFVSRLLGLLGVQKKEDYYD